jgi:phenylacetate 2-hydroxylase
LPLHQAQAENVVKVIACIPDLTTLDVDYWGADAATFNPKRWLDPPDSSQSPSLYIEKPSSSTPHLSFGAGSRSCPGATIASKLIAAALFRIISLYKIEASTTEPPNTDYVDYNAIKSALVAIPRDFKVKLTPRDGTGDLAREVLRMSEERTRDFYKE